MIAPPDFLFMEVNKRCNLRCPHCVFWQVDDGDRAPTSRPGRRPDVYAEFAEIRPVGALVICGGEPMLDLDDYFALAGDGRSLGFRCLSVINGTRVRTSNAPTRWCSTGRTRFPSRSTPPAGAARPDAGVQRRVRQGASRRLGCCSRPATSNGKERGCS